MSDLPLEYTIVKAVTITNCDFVEFTGTKFQFSIVQNPDSWEPTYHTIFEPSVIVVRTVPNFSIDDIHKLSLAWKAWGIPRKQRLQWVEDIQAAFRNP